MAVAAELVRLRGNVAGAAKTFAVHRSSLQELIGKTPALQQVLRDAREGMKDHAESALYNAVIAGEAWAVCFFLKTQGKDRGYVERQEVEHSEPVQLHIVKKVVRAANRDAGSGAAPGAG